MATRNRFGGLPGEFSSVVSLQREVVRDIRGDGSSSYERLRSISTAGRGKFLRCQLLFQQEGLDRAEQLLAVVEGRCVRTFFQQHELGAVDVFDHLIDEVLRDYDVVLAQED